MSSSTAGSSTVVILSTARHLPADVLTVHAWDALRAGNPVHVGSSQHPLLPALSEAGIAVTVVDGHPDEVAATVLTCSSAVWIAAHDDDPVADRLRTNPQTFDLVGSIDPPGASVLAAVAVMDRLRSPGGCPWDAEQTHESLTKYLLEEAYEAVELIENGQHADLAEEIGDVLLQVLFHGRIASERTDGTGWTVDDAAEGLVAKLVRRHPHVFGDVAVDGTADVVANWDVLKAQEKGRTSVTEGVPLAQPALALAEKLLARSGRAGLPAHLLDAELGEPARVLRELLLCAPAAVASDADDAASDAVAEAYVGRVLLLVVAFARSLGVNPETALRAAARSYAQRIQAAENAQPAADAG